MIPSRTPEAAADEVAGDAVAAAIDAATDDDLPESDDERAAVAASRAEPDGFVPRDEVACVLEAWSRPKSA